MKAVMSRIPPEILEWRRRTGAERWDEMWEGVLHMPPMPNREHQDLEFCLESYLRHHWAGRAGGRVHHQINVAGVGGWPKNYRIPDLVLLLPDRFGIDRNEYFEGGPNVVVEIRSPDDETYEKLPFYAGVGVDEVWVIQRDTREAELFVLEGGEYRPVIQDEEGWLHSPATGVRLRPVPGARIELQVGADEATLDTVPGC